MQRVLELDEPKQHFGVRKLISSKDGLMLNTMMRNHGHAATASNINCINFLIQNGAHLQLEPEDPLSNYPLFAYSISFFFFANSHVWILLALPVCLRPSSNLYFNTSPTRCGSTLGLKTLPSRSYSRYTAMFLCVSICWRSISWRTETLQNTFVR